MVRLALTTRMKSSVVVPPMKLTWPIPSGAMVMSPSEKGVVERVRASPWRVKLPESATIEGFCSPKTISPELFMKKRVLTVAEPEAETGIPETVSEFRA